METEIECTFTGKKAVIVLCIILLLLGVRLWYFHRAENRALTKEAIIQTIDPYVKAYYSRKALPDLQSATASNDVKRIERITREITRIEYKSISVKGFWSPLVVRAEITTDGKTPPDGKTFRYFKIEYSDLWNGWTCGQDDNPISCETNEFAYKRRLVVREQWNFATVSADR